MQQGYETYELTHAYKELKRLLGRDMTASGVHIRVEHIGGAEVCEFQFLGERLPELIPVLLASLTETLEMRRDTARSDLIKIERALKGEL
jgi:hypothetical protein